MRTAFTTMYYFTLKNDSRKNPMGILQMSKTSEKKNYQGRIQDIVLGETKFGDGSQYCLRSPAGPL